MNFFELKAVDISSLNDGDLRDLVARLCEAELVQQGIPTSDVTWGGAQEAPDGGLDVSVKSTGTMFNPNFVPRENTGFQVKKHSMGKSACRKEMEEHGIPKKILEDLATQKGSYIIVSGKDDCSDKMLAERLSGMKEAVNALPSKDDLYLDFYGRDRLLAWLRRHPSVALWVRFRLGKTMTGWKPFGRWGATPPNQDDEFLADNHPCVVDLNSNLKDPIPILNGVLLTRDKLRKFGSTVRITGLSGVGKTRFAQALFEPTVGLGALPASDVIYADLGDNLTPTASELVTYLIANDFATYLVLDNCPPDVHRSLQKQVVGSRAKLRLLTIEYDISEDKPEETEVIHLEPSSEETASKLVQKRFPGIGRVNAIRIAEFSGGNARVALALASRVSADETLSNFSDEDLFQRLFSQRKGSSPELLQSAEALALVYSFNISYEENHDELSNLGVIAGLTRQALHRNQAELFRRQLAQQRGNWRAVLPHALANRLAKRAIENIPPRDINDVLFKPTNLRLLQSCAHRLGYLHDFEPARELACTWLQPGAPLANVAFCSEHYMVVLCHVAPVFPEVVLHAIEMATATPKFASRENANFRRFVQLLCSIAYEDGVFERAADVLLKFAETEKAGENSDSIVDKMKQLFSLYLSGTEALPERRQTFIQKLLKSGSQRHLEIAKELLNSALSVRSWTAFGTFHFGARKRSSGWQPRTSDERIAWYVGYIQLLQPVLCSPQPQYSDWAKSLLASRFRGLWSFSGCFDVLEQIIHEHGPKGNWPKMWISIKETLAFDSDKHTPQLLARLKSLEKITAPSDLFSDIEAFVLINPWDHVKLEGSSLQDEKDEIHEKVIGFGTIAALQPSFFERFGAKLWETRTQPLLWFGKGLALGSIDKFSMFNLLVESFQKHRSDQSNILLLEGYLKGLNDSAPGEARQILECALNIPELMPDAVNLLLTTSISAWTAKKLLELAQSGLLEAWRFEQIAYVGVHESITDDELSKILAELNVLDRGYLSTIRIISRIIFQKRQCNYTPSIKLRVVAREAIRRIFVAHRDGFNLDNLYGIETVLGAAFDMSTSEHEVKKTIELLCSSLRDYRFYAFDITEIIKFFVGKYTSIFLDVVFDGSEGEEILATSLFREEISGGGGILNVAPIEKILAWCGTDQARITKASKSVRAYSAVGTNDVVDETPKQMIMSKHVMSLLELAQNKLAIVEIIFENTFPGGWSGSLADILEVRSEAFAELLRHYDTEVQALVRTKLTDFAQNIRAEREREALRNNEREQRFE